MFALSRVSSAIHALPEAASKRALLGMKASYRAVIKDFQKMMPIEDTLLKALTCVNPKEQKAYNFLQHCRVVANEMHNVQQEVEVISGNEWIRYQDIEVAGDDVKIRIDKFWHKIFNRTDASREHFMILPIMVKYALALCHSNSDVEILFSAKKECLQIRICPYVRRLSSAIKLPKQLLNSVEVWIKYQ